MDFDETVIRITGDGTVSVERNEDGTTTYKLIEPESLVECIDKSIKRDGIKSGLLPPNCISFAQNEAGKRTLYLLHPEDRATLTFMDTVYEKFPLPRLVFGFTVGSDGRVSGARLGVTEADGHTKPDAKMYRWPFSNVNGTNLCLGNNTLPRYAGPHKLAGLPYHILSMPHNMDHFTAANNRSGLGLRELLEHLRDKRPTYYYGNVLVESGETLGEFVLHG